ncbi:MAG: hypothetical protein KDA31_11615 [Phycisphaerales bacterium]|nr:hypothetical protein [Phycisphaerales bacterium]MCB9836175.1 hypothetical protein [Phycisphaera sp.]
MLRRTLITQAALLCTLAGSASANVFTIDWLNMSPVPNGQQVPNNSNYFLPGLGNVNVSYNISSDFFHGRNVEPLLQNQGFTSGPDTYNWTNHELFAATLLTGPDPLVAVPWDVTFTFSGTVNPGQIYVGVAGLGSTTSSGGGSTIATVNQNGTYLGEYIGPNNWGPTQFTGGPGTFSMQNSLSAPGGVDPHWNTGLAVVRIDDAVSSITVHFSHIRGDGAGVNIGYIPAPSSAALLSLSGLVAFRRRR